MRRVLLIGLDGADPLLTERWISQGLLPNLARLATEGTFLRCASTVPPATFPAWTTCVTGVNPGRHGIVDFTEMHPGKYEVRFVNASRRERPALWEILSNQDKRVCVLGVPGAYPPDRVNGIMVSGFDSPVAGPIDRSFVYPESAYNKVRDWRYGAFQEGHIGPHWHGKALLALLDKIAAKERVACELLHQEPWDFFMAVFGESDTVAHHFWMYHDPDSPRHKPGMEDAILRVYQRLDASVGALRDAAGDAAVMVVSDHGFGGAGSGVVHLNNWLAARGYLSFSSQRGSLAKALALRLAPQAIRGTLFRRFAKQAARAESRSRFAGIDWARTQAFSEELNYFPSVRVNLKGREPDGQVDPAEYNAFCEALCEHLESWEPVAKAWRREQLYDGPCAERAPDIILQLAFENGYSYSCLRSRGGPPLRRLEPREFVGGKERGMNGTHRPTGLWLLSEPVASRHASLEDVAPTVLALLGAAGPEMEGTSLTASAGETREPLDRAPQGRGYTPEQEARIEAQLRALGYFE